MEKMRKIKTACQWIAMIAAIVCFAIAASAKSREGMIVLGFGCQTAGIMLRRIGRKDEDQ